VPSTDHQVLGDLGVGPAAGHEHRNVVLARRQHEVCVRGVRVPKYELDNGV